MNDLRRWALGTIALGLITFSFPAIAVTYGEPDGDAHPHVGLIIFDTGGNVSHRCTGTLLSPQVMLTAGHCTYGTSGGRVWFEADIESGIPGNGYPFGGGTSIELAAIFTHPDYIDNAFYLYDVGVVVLSQPVFLPEYGVLPPLGILDGLAVQRGLQGQIFTPVGYGLQGIKPVFQADRVRYVGEVMLIDVKGTNGIPAGTSVLFTNTPGQKAAGGTCFGDSGGPIFWGDTNIIVAVTSYAVNANCKGTGGGYRIDKALDQSLIMQVLSGVSGG